MKKRSEGKQEGEGLFGTKEERRVWDGIRVNRERNGCGSALVCVAFY